MPKKFRGKFSAIICKRTKDGKLLCNLFRGWDGKEEYTYVDAASIRDGNSSSQSADQTIYLAKSDKKLNCMVDDTELPSGRKTKTLKCKAREFK